MERKLMQEARAPTTSAVVEALPSTEQPPLDSFGACGFRVNGMDPAELFERREEAPFLRPTEMERLSPFMPLVEDNWRRAMKAGEPLLWFGTLDGPGGEPRGSVSSWRSTHTTWHTQYAVSLANPLASRAALLSAAAVRHQNSQQNWFQPANCFANDVFASIVPNLGVGRASVDDFGYVAVSPGVLPPHHDDLVVVGCQDNRGGHQDDLFHLAFGTRGLAYAKSEELDHEDLNLDGLDATYRRVRLRRYRKIWLAYTKMRDEVVGAVIAYSGPLGFNFSFLENRCDLIIHPMLSRQMEIAVSLYLVAMAAYVYEDFPPGIIPVVSGERTAKLLAEAGGKRIHRYSQAVFLSSAYENWCRHVQEFRDRPFYTGRRQSGPKRPGVESIGLNRPCRNGHSIPGSSLQLVTRQMSHSSSAA